MMIKIRYILVCISILLFIPLAYSHLCDNVFRQADKLIVKPESYNLTIKEQTSFKIFLQNNMDRAIAEISLIVESRAFNFNVSPQVMRIPKGSRVYFTVTISPKPNIKTGYYPINFRLVGGGRQFKSFSLNVHDQQVSRQTSSKSQEYTVQKNTTSATKVTTSTTYISDEDRTKLLNIRPLAAAPKIDGALDDDCWKKAAVLSNFSSENGGNAAFPTIVLSSFDNNSLYFAVYCQGVDIGKLSQDDSVEIQLTRDSLGGSFYSFILSAVGSPKLQRIFNKGSVMIEVPENISYCIFSDADYWSAEAAIPFPALKTVCPSSTAKWFVRITRVQSSGSKERSYWAQDVSGYNKEEGLGEVLLVP